MKKAVLLLLLASSSLWSQVITEVTNDNYDLVTNYVRTNNIDYSLVDGSPYLNPNFAPAKINEIKETQFVRFNVVENTIEIQLPGNKIIAIDFTKNPYTIVLNDGSDKHYETHCFVDTKGNLEYTFLELVHRNEKYSLFLKERIKFIEKKEGVARYVDAVNAKFLKIDAVFYVTDLVNRSDTLQPLSRKKKNFSEPFMKQSKEIEKFRKQEDLDMTTARDWIAVLDYYFELKS
jgi:hypothetical protein